MEKMRLTHWPCSPIDPMANAIMQGNEDSSKRFAQEPLASTRAKLVCEIQFLTPYYYDMRKKTHAWYKICRAENAMAMTQDYIGGLHDD